MGLSTAYSGPGGQNVREAQGGYEYNSPAASSGGSSIPDWLKSVFSFLGSSSGATLIGSGLDFLGNLYTNRQNRRSIEETNRLNYQMQQEQNAWNERMWHMNNEYNTPANQMQRLKEAGLNPNLLYGNPSQGTSSAPAQGTNPAQAQAFQSLGFGDMFSNAQQLMMQKKANDANIRLMQAQADSLDAETTLKERGMSLDEKRVNLQERELETSIQQFAEMKPYYEAQIDKIKSDKKVSDEQADEIFWRNMITSRTYGHQMEMLHAELQKLKSEYNLNNKQADYYQHMAELYSIEVLKGNVDYSVYGLQKFYETEMMRNAYIRDDHSLFPDLNAIEREDKLGERRFREYNHSWNIFMRYVGATTGAIGNIFSGNANYQLNSGLSSGSNFKSKFKLHF